MLWKSTRPIIPDVKIRGKFSAIIYRRRISLKKEYKIAENNAESGIVMTQVRSIF